MSSRKGRGGGGVTRSLKFNAYFNLRHCSYIDHLHIADQSLSNCPILEETTISSSLSSTEERNKFNWNQKHKQSKFNVITCHVGKGGGGKTAENGWMWEEGEAWIPGESGQEETAPDEGGEQAKVRINPATCHIVQYTPVTCHIVRYTPATCHIVQYTPIKCHIISYVDT